MPCKRSVGNTRMCDFNRAERRRYPVENARMQKINRGEECKCPVGMQNIEMPTGRNGVKDLLKYKKQNTNSAIRLKYPVEIW